MSQNDDARVCVTKGVNIFSRKLLVHFTPTIPRQPTHPRVGHSIDPDLAVQVELMQAAAGSRILEVKLVPIQWKQYLKHGSGKECETTSTVHMLTITNKDCIVRGCWLE